MPKHVYDSLSLEPLNKISIVILLADHSFVYLLSVIKDVLVEIDSLVIPCDFYILDMEHDSCDSSNSTPILFGRPFLKTTNTKIDCGMDTLSIEVGDEKIEFNFHDAMTYRIAMFILSHVMTKLISVCSKFVILILRLD
jgi:hypothetical protein